MQLTLACDRCHTVGPAEIFRQFDYCQDLCPSCWLDATIEDLKRDVAKKRKEMEEIQLAEILRLEAELAELTKAKP